ncbi:LysM peptidoglycan-binding domain-containing protein, partial [bacterium]|nr:LysM peptidoglycan-binding domain-containing protein [bacterium]
MPEPGYDPNAVSSFYNPSSTPTPKLRPSGLGSRPSTADNKGSSAVFSAPKPTYSSNDNNDNSDKRLTPVTALYSSTAASLADAGARLAKNSETRITPMNLYDQKNMQEMQTELEDYLRGVDIEDAIAADMARMAVPEVYTGETDDVTVKAGDTLTAIAKDKGVSLQELIAANPQ